MGNLGFPEMRVIVVVALLFFGPGKLPEIGKSLGKGIAEFKRAFTNSESADNKPTDPNSQDSSDASNPPSQT